MNDLTVFEQNGQLLTDSREVALMVEKDHAKLLRDIRSYCTHLTEANFGLSEYFIESEYQDSTGRTLPCYLCTKKGCDMIANKMIGKKGVIFTAKYTTAFEKMKDFIQKGTVYVGIPLKEQVESLEAVADMLRMNDASRLLMLKGFYKGYNIPTGFLPKYEFNDSRQMKAATTLLKEKGYEISAVRFNKLLVEQGYLEEKSRPSSKGKDAKFKSLTEKGLQYGENAVSPHNQKETQPLYEQTQQQRKMETAMRAQRTKVDLLKESGADPDDIMLARAKYQAQLNEYSRFSKKMGLVEQRERIYQDMRGRVATNTRQQNARYTPEMMRNASKDSKEFAKLKNILGNDAGSLADFRQMKYNNPEEYEIFKRYAKSVDNGMISPLSGFKNYSRLHESIENNIVGSTTHNGIKITGQSTHFLERVIGTKEDPKTHRPRSGVSIEDIQDALLNGAVRVRERDPNSIKYVTDKCIVSLNPKTGNLIQCNPQ